MLDYLDHRILVSRININMKALTNTKIILLALFAVLVLIILLAQLGIFSGSAPADLGVSSNRLQAPTKSENSVSSQAYYFNKTEANVNYAQIEALNYKGNGKTALANLKEVISSNFKEAKLIAENENYLRYEFKSGLMKFTDDVEFLLNENENYIHFRSASRLGRKDFGKNRERIEEIRKKFIELNMKVVK